MNEFSCRYRQLGLQDYQPVWQAMKKFTQAREPQTVDEIWLVEHPSVFTQGQAGKPEHLLNPGSIPVVQVDRGGQVTYHGPGQQVVYFLLDIRRRKMGVRQLVSTIEKIVIDILSKYQILATAKPDAPGVYVGDKKICSLGLKISRGCSYHGLALNIAMDKEPFSRINPCGYSGLEIIQTSEVGGPKKLVDIEQALLASIKSNLHIGHFSQAESIKFD